jgi:putative Holliday junction resolvase
MVLDRRPHQAFLAKVRGLLQEYETDFLVLGLPRRTDGRLGPEAQRVMALAYELRTKLKAKIDTWEEWLTTVAAERVLKEGGLSARQRRAVVDKTAATLILDGYLARHGSTIKAQNL